MKLQYFAAPLLFAAMPLTACYDSPAEAPSRRAATATDPLATMSFEGEVLVKLYEDGAPITGNDYEIELIPLDSVVASRLHGSTSLRMWYNPLPSQGWGASWYDPDSNDGAATCGEILRYDSDDMSARGAEQHDPAPGVKANGPETHCIRPGRYHLIVWQNDVSVREFDVEYAQATLIRLGSNCSSPMIRYPASVSV